MSDNREPLSITAAQRRYDAMIGVGGIGTGAFFALNGDHTLGREESRSGHFLKRKDYCKLHIITHYVQVLLGASFETFPIGRIGDDKEGKHLLAEIEQVWLNTDFIEVVPQGQTLFSFCFVYPDGSGGNLTTDNSVNSTVDAACIDQAKDTFATFSRRGIALAVPEVSLEARLRLVELGTAENFFCASALTSEEINSALATQILSYTNLLGLNLDEAAAIAGLDANLDQPLSVVQAAMTKLNQIKPNMWIAITAGSQGSWTWDGCLLNHYPAIKTAVESTAGAGDAFLAGILVGLTAHLNLPLAQELGTLVAALSVTSPDTIHWGLDRQMLSTFVEKHRVPVATQIVQLLKESVLETDHQ